MDASNAASAREAQFRAVLLPHRTALRKGFVTIAAVVGGISLVTGAVLHPFGAWPLAVLLMLDMILIGAALRASLRVGRMYETVELNNGELRLTRVSPSGEARRWTFNPYWVRLEFDDGGSGASRLQLRSHGRVLTFAHFLSNEERRGFAAALAAALSDARGTRI